MTHSSEPWEWLAACVTLDGQGYVFLKSPAGGQMAITDEQRQRIVACVKFLKGVPQQVLEDFLAEHAHAHSPDHEHPRGHEKSCLDQVRRFIRRYHELNPHLWRPPHYGWAGGFMNGDDIP